jgi:hypothetical protein
MLYELQQLLGIFSSCCNTLVVIEDCVVLGLTPLKGLEVGIFEPVSVAIV